MTDPHEETLAQIEALIRQGAEVRLGKRRMRVVIKIKDVGGIVKLACDIAAWDAYKASGRPMPQHVQSGLR